MASGFPVVAIIAAFNEADIIEHVVTDLIEQGIDVYFLDDGSTDDTAAIVERHLGRGVLSVERLAPVPDGRFGWERILQRKAQLATELAASWFIHHDADEFRESPWAHLSLVEAIRRVDTLGYNAIDFKGLDFWPVRDQFQPGEDVRATLTAYSEPAPYDRVQIRAWKKTGDVDLISSGGHEARFPNRRVFPLRFILRHYPIRGQAHGERKVFHERRDRFVEQERARGWHVQYDEIAEGDSFLRDLATLTPFDPDAVRIGLTLRHRGVEELEESIEASRHELARTREQLTAEVASLRVIQEEQTAVLMHARAELATRNEDLVRMHQELMNRSRDLDQRNHELGDRSRELDERNREIVQRNRDLATERAALDASRAQVRGLSAALEQRTAEVAAYQQSVEDGARRLRELEQSFSWRWMAPARAAFRVLRGR